MRNVKPLREEHAETTRKAVLAAARDLFAKRGYDAVLLDEVAAAARVTKGAIYHHFESKLDLFRTIYEEQAAEVEVRVRKRMAKATNPIERADVAIDAFFDCADDDVIRAVLFRDGMAALRGECHAINDRYFLGLLREVLDELTTAGLLNGLDTPLLARMLLAMLVEASHVLGDPERPRTARAALKNVLRRMIGGMLGPAR